MLPLYKHDPQINAALESQNLINATAFNWISTVSPVMSCWSHNMTACQSVIFSGDLRANCMME